MSKTISLKIQENLFTETETLVHKINIKRNPYINQALKYYNRLIKRRLLREQYQNESALVKGESLAVNHEFEQMEDDILGI